MRWPGNPIVASSGRSRIGAGRHHNFGTYQNLIPVHGELVEPFANYVALMSYICVLRQAQEERTTRVNFDDEDKHQSGVPAIYARKRP